MERKDRTKAILRVKEVEERRCLRRLARAREEAGAIEDEVARAERDLEEEIGASTAALRALTETALATARRNLAAARERLTDTLETVVASQAELATVRAEAEALRRAGHRRHLRRARRLAYRAERASEEILRSLYTK